MHMVSINNSGYSRYRTHKDSAIAILNMHVTFDLSEIEKVMPQLAWKQLERELEQPFVALVAFAVCIRLFLTSPVHSSVEPSSQAVLGGRNGLATSASSNCIRM